VYSPGVCLFALQALHEIIVRILHLAHFLEHCHFLNSSCDWTPFRSVVLFHPIENLGAVSRISEECEWRSWFKPRSRAVLNTVYLVAFVNRGQGKYTLPDVGGWQLLPFGPRLDLVFPMV
jgi:hypothetical protein